MGTRRKIGEGHAEAMGRLGMREIRGAVYPGSNVAQPSEYGLYGTMTQGEVAEARRGDGTELEEEKKQDSILQRELDRPDDPGEDPGRDLDRD
jgi:hypothetical protein